MARQNSLEFDKDLQAKRVILVSGSGTSVPTEFNVNDVIEASSTITYICSENSDGAWYVKKVDTSSNVNISHATVKNNPTITSYSSAFAARASLVYGDYSEAF